MSAAQELGALLARAGRGPRIVVLPAPRLEPVSLLRASRKQDAWLLERLPDGDDGGELVLGLGSALRTPLPARGGEALTTHLAVGWARVVHPDADAELAARLPLCLIGHAFAPGASDEEPWSDHGDGQAVAPRWTYLARGERAVLAYACEGEPFAGQTALVAAELETLLGAGGALGTPPRVPCRVSLDAERAALFHDRVEAAREAIARGELGKVVCSRRASAFSERDLEPEAILSRLGGEAALRFLVRRGASTLVGATPERLFRKRGTHLRTEALAGTRAQGSLAAEQSLLASRKDIAEHAPVVEAIVSRLEALGAQVHAEASPRLKRSANVVHLRTAIDAELTPDTSAVALLDTLHPTPAVGGTPRERAGAFIVAHEPPRGWYSGPLGWVDALGDADVHVVLRCGVVRGARAGVFAGGGIVASSDPQQELVETELKMAPMLRAIGVPEDETASRPEIPRVETGRAETTRLEARPDVLRPEPARAEPRP